MRLAAEIRIVLQDVRRALVTDVGDAGNLVAIALAQSSASARLTSCSTCWRARG